MKNSFICPVMLVLLSAMFAFAVPQKGTMTDPRDGKKYKTVKIGEQVWMAENLNYKSADSRCYENKDANCKKYGRLYSWADAVDSNGTFSGYNLDCEYLSQCEIEDPVQGICPEGWHLPSDGDFEKLMNSVGGEDEAEKKLRAKKGWNKKPIGNDDYGFSLLASGIFEREHSFYGDEKSYTRVSRLWSSSARAISWYAVENMSYLIQERGKDGAAYSVRCLKDEEPADKSKSLIEAEIKKINENDVRTMIQNDQCVLFRDRIDGCSKLLENCSQTITITNRRKNKVVSLVFEDKTINEIAESNGRDLKVDKELNFVVGIEPASNRPVLILFEATSRCQGRHCREQSVYALKEKTARFLAESDSDVVNAWLLLNGARNIHETFFAMGLSMGYARSICSDRSLDGLKETTDNEEENPSSLDEEEMQNESGSSRSEPKAKKTRKFVRQQRKNRTEKLADTQIEENSPKDEKPKTVTFGVHMALLAGIPVLAGDPDRKLTDRIETEVGFHVSAYKFVLGLYLGISYIDYTRVRRYAGNENQKEYMSNYYLGIPLFYRYPFAESYYVTGGVTYKRLLNFLGYPAYSDYIALDGNQFRFSLGVGKKFEGIDIGILLGMEYLDDEHSQRAENYKNLLVHLGLNVDCWF